MSTKPQNDINQIGLNIAYFRKAKGMKQKDLAEAVYISNNYLCEIETRKKIPTVQLIYNIADALEIPVNKIFEEH